MTKTKRTLRAILALVMALVMVGSVIPTMTYAADVADNLENTLDQSATFLEKVTNAFYNFFQRIVNFFRNLFGKGDEEPEPEPEVPDDNKNEVGDEEALKAVLKDGGKVYLAQDFVCKGGEPIVIPGNVKITIYLQGNTIKNPVSGKPAIINKGELVIYGDGAIINGANDENGSHTISNEGTLVINGGNIGTDYTAGAAVYNNGGFVTINGGIYASKQESVAGDSRSAYALVNGKGTIIVNNANLEGKTHGLFAAYDGKFIVNGGMYKLNGNGGLGCDVVYAEGTAEVLLIGGIVHTNNPRNNHVFFVANDGNKFDQDAVATDNITYVGTEIYLNGVKQEYSEATPWTVSGTLYLKDVTITAKEGNALTVKDDAKIIIDGEVKLIGAKNGAGIFVEENARLEITGSGSLTVIGNEGKEYDAKQYYSEGNYADFEGTGGSGIAVANKAMLVVDGLNELTAEGYGVNAFGIGGNGAAVKVEDSTIKYVRGGFVNLTGKYYDEESNLTEPVGGAAIGGSDIGIVKAYIIKAEGGSKAAGIGAQCYQPSNITVRFSEIDKVVGGSSSAGIGGSAIDNTYPGQDVKIIIEDSKISAYGGYFGAGIGSGYDTNCSPTEKAPMHAIYIKGNSEINATGGKYAAGIGTGFRVANLKGEIETTVKVTAQSGEKLYLPEFTRAQDVGFGVVDPDKEAANNYCTFKYRGIEFGIPQPINPATSVIVTEKLDFMIGDKAKAIEVTIAPENATIIGKSFISSDESVATVDATGLVTPVALGTATITVTVVSNDGTIKTAETVVIVRSENGAYPVASTADINEAIKAGEKNIILVDDIALTTSIEIAEGAKVAIDGNGHTIARADGGEAVAMINLGEGAKITLEDVIVDGGAIWSGEVDATLGRGTENTGVATTGAIIVAANNSAIVLGEGAVLQNNDGAYAVNLGTRIGATLTLNGGEIINNNSGSGAVWGGGHITINSGKINSNSSTGLAGAIRMVGNCNLTMNGGEINNNKATTNGGAIWGYGASTYNFNGGEMAYNSGAVGGAIYTGDSSVINISGDFELHNNTGTEGGAVRFTNRTTLNMTGGKIYDNTSTNNSNWDAFYGWNIAANIKGGEISDDFTLDSGLYCTLGAADITGVVHFALNTGHNTALLTSDFKGFKFTVANGDNFAAFNLKPADGYVYTEGDEDKLVCMNEGYKTYWDADKGVFKIKSYIVSVKEVGELRDAINNPSDSVIKADGLGPITTSDIGTADGNYTKVDVKAGLSIKGLTVDFNGSNHVFVSAGETGEVVFENCVFTCPDFDGRVYFQSGVNATGVKLVFNNCTFKGPTIFADNSGGGVEFNNCSFEVNDSGYGFVQCMGGTDVFNDCQFNISGSKTMNIGSITKYAHLNLYSVQFNTVVYLNRCNSVSIHRYNFSGGSGTVKYG